MPSLKSHCWMHAYCNEGIAKMAHYFQHLSWFFAISNGLESREGCSFTTSNSFGAKIKNGAGDAVCEKNGGKILANRWKWWKSYALCFFATKTREVNNNNASATIAIAASTLVNFNYFNNPSPNGRAKNITTSTILFINLGNGLPNGLVLMLAKQVKKDRQIGVVKPTTKKPMQKLKLPPQQNHPQNHNLLVTKEAKIWPKSNWTKATIPRGTIFLLLLRAMTKMTITIILIRMANGK